MPSGRVLEENQVYLNGKFYSIKGKVERFMASEFPTKTVFGDYGPDSSPLVSSITWEDWRGGQGLGTAKLPDDINRCSYSECDLSSPGHLTLSALVSQTGAFASSADGCIGYIELSNVVYAATSVTANTVQSYNNGSDTWTSVRALASAPTDIKVGRVGTTGSITIVVATGSEVDYSTDGSSWSRLSTIGIKYIAFLNNVLWGITNAGITYFTVNLASGWTEVGRLQYPTGYASKLFPGHRADGALALYLASKIGLHIYKEETETWEDTPMTFPYHPAGGAGAYEWGATGNIYYSAGSAIYEFNSSSGSYRSLGLEQFDKTLVSVASAQDTWVVAVTGSLTHLYVLTNARFDGVAHPNYASTHYTVIRWNRQGFDQLYINNVGAVNDTLATNHFYPLISNTYSVYRFWFPRGTRASYASVPLSLRSPYNTTGWTYATTNLHDTPWIVNNTDQNWIAAEIVVDSTHPTSSETVEIQYATNYSTSLTNVATKSASGLTRYALPTTGDSVGVSFRAIAIRLTLTRSTNTNTPDVKKVTLVYHKSPKVLWGFKFTVDGLINPDQPGTPHDIRHGIFDAAELTTLAEFTYKNEANDTENHFVHVSSVSAKESTGPDSGEYVVTVTEVL